MKTYSEFRPTAFDVKGLALEDKQDWLVCPVCITRDTGEWTVSASNFAVLNAILDEVDPSGEDHEIHRFGHWGPGWFEIVIVRPGSRAAGEAEDCEACLADYPVLDDKDLSEREWNEACEQWELDGDGGEMPEYEMHEEGAYFYRDGRRVK